MILLKLSLTRMIYYCLLLTVKLECNVANFVERETRPIWFQVLFNNTFDQEHTCALGFKIRKLTIHTSDRTKSYIFQRSIFRIDEDLGPVMEIHINLSTK